MHVVWHHQLLLSISLLLQGRPLHSNTHPNFRDRGIVQSSEIPLIMQSMNIQSSQAAVPPTSPRPAANTRPIPTIAYSWRQQHPKAQLFYIRDHKAANKALERLDGNAYGFDLEWKPNFVRGQRENRVSLVQIANHAVILLLQVSAMQGEANCSHNCYSSYLNLKPIHRPPEFPSRLYEFLLNPKIVKAGVGIQG